MERFAINWVSAAVCLTVQAHFTGVKELKIRYWDAEKGGILASPCKSFWKTGKIKSLLLLQSLGEPKLWAGEEAQRETLSLVIVVEDLDLVI